MKVTYRWRCLDAGCELAGWQDDPKGRPDLRLEAHGKATGHSTTMSGRPAGASWDDVKEPQAGG